jgi:hypothetical protein
VQKYSTYPNQAYIYESSDGSHYDLENITWDSICLPPLDWWDDGFYVEGRIASLLWDLIDSAQDGEDKTYLSPYNYIWYPMGLYNQYQGEPCNFCTFWRDTIDWNYKLEMGKTMYYNTIKIPPPGHSCRGDNNNEESCWCADISPDCDITVTDFSYFGAHWNESSDKWYYNRHADINFNGTIDVPDFACLGAQWNDCPCYGSCIGCD